MLWGLNEQQRIDLAKSKMAKVVDHFLWLLEIHANNSFVVYSPMLSEQIPTSFAANAFNVFQRSMYQFEIVRLCALWDGVDQSKENIPTVIKLIDDDAIIEALAIKAGQPWKETLPRLLNPSSDPEVAVLAQQALRDENNRYADEQSLRAKSELKKTIADCKQILLSPQLTSIMNLRDKHIAHALTATRREKHGPVAVMKLVMKPIS